MASKKKKIKGDQDKKEKAPGELRTWFTSGGAMQAWMGHASINTTIKHYGHLVKSFRKEEIKQIEGRMDTCVDTRNKKEVTESRNPLNFMVPPAGVEPAAPGLGNLCSILLS